MRLPAYLLTVPDFAKVSEAIRESDDIASGAVATEPSGDDSDKADVRGNNGSVVPEVPLSSLGPPPSMPLRAIEEEEDLEGYEPSDPGDDEDMKALETASEGEPETEAEASAGAGPHTDRRNAKGSCNFLLPLALPASEQHMWVSRPLQASLKPLAWLGQNGVVQHGFCGSASLCGPAFTSRHPFTVAPGSASAPRAACGLFSAVASPRHSRSAPFLASQCLSTGCQSRGSATWGQIYKFNKFKGCNRG